MVSQKSIKFPHAVRRDIFSTEVLFRVFISLESLNVENIESATGSSEVSEGLMHSTKSHARCYLKSSQRH